MDERKDAAGVGVGNRRMGRWVMGWVMGGPRHDLIRSDPIIPPQCSDLSLLLSLVSRLSLSLSHITVMSSLHDLKRPSFRLKAKATSVSRPQSKLWRNMLPKIHGVSSMSTKVAKVGNRNNHHTPHPSSIPHSSFSLPHSLQLFIRSHSHHSATPLLLTHTLPYPPVDSTIAVSSVGTSDPSKKFPEWRA